MTDFGIIIPARMGSSRLPGKPLREIAGKPLIQWTVENAWNAGAQFVWVATEDEGIAAVVRSLGGKAVLTSAEHPTGTDRLAEVVDKEGLASDTLIVNVQGDEPLLSARSIQTVARALAEHPQAGIATLAHPIASVSELFDPSAVKVELDRAGLALTFSRAPIPWVREAFSHGPPAELPAGVPFLRHVGLYAYRASALSQLAATPQPAIERAEQLEQLRALHAGVSIHVTVLDEGLPPGVDTEADLLRVEALLRQA